MKNLLIISYDYPPSNGGIARLCSEVAVGMQEYYESVKVITLENVSDNRSYNFENVEVIRFSNKRILCEISIFLYLFFRKEKRKTDVICGLWHPEATISYLAGFRNVFILGHGTEFLFGTSKLRKYFWLPVYAKWILKRAKLCIANSHYTEQLIQKINKKIRTEALPLAVNPDFFHPKHETVNGDGLLRICTVSRVLKFKGHDFIAQTIANLPEHLKNKIHWNIGGTGEYLEGLKQKIQELKIEKQVTFHGFIPDEELPSFYSENNVFILCTREQETSTQVEGFGLVFLEAQACGLPVIGTRTGGIPDAIEPENGGWLIEQDNEENLSSILQEIIQYPEILLRESEKARKRVEAQYTWEKYTKKLHQLLQH